jgi:hypothetical protein
MEVSFQNNSLEGAYMERYTQFNLDSSAIEYLLSYISKAKKHYTFPKSLLTDITVEKGHVITYLPVGTDPKYLREFFYGGVASLNKTQQWFASKVNDFLREDIHNCCLFPDYLIKPKYLSTTELDTNYLVIYNQIYHYLNNNHIDDLDFIVNTIRASDSGSILIGILTKLVNNSEYFKGIKEFSKKEINILVQNTQKIIIGGWDGEGYLIWSKNE